MTWTHVNILLGQSVLNISTMIKEILILILLYQHSNTAQIEESGEVSSTRKVPDEDSSGTIEILEASSSTSKSGIEVDLKTLCTERTEVVQILVNDGGDICIPNKYFDKLQFIPSEVIMDERLDIEIINIVDFQIIEIGTNELTLSMNIFIHWHDNRLFLTSPGQNSDWIYLSTDNKKRIWSPNLVISNHMFSKTKEGEEFALMNTGYSAVDLIQNYNSSTPIVTVLEEVSNLAMKTFYLSTKIKCDMDFKNFPFDEHVCNLEVS